MPAMPQRNEAGCVAVLAGGALLVLSAGAWVLLVASGEGAALEEAAGDAPAPAEPQREGPPVPATPPADADPPWFHPSRVASPEALRRAGGPATPVADPELQRLLAKACARKAADPAYAAARRLPGIPRDPDRLPFEDEVKAARARLAAAAKAPPGVAPLAVPALAPGSVRVDGVPSEAEWGGALEVPLGDGARLLLGHEGGRLLAAAEARGDRTGSGYDQFRLYLHTGLSPTVANERVHLAGSGSPHALRQTTLPWAGSPKQGADEGWKDHPLTDWNVLERCAGASTLDGYRRYELSVDLAEAGIPSGAPFPVRVEIEGDPETVDGKFRRRVILATLGTEAAPAWFTLE